MLCLLTTHTHAHTLSFTRPLFLYTYFIYAFFFFCYCCCLCLVCDSRDTPFLFLPSPHRQKYALGTKRSAAATAAAAVRRCWVPTVPHSCTNWSSWLSNFSKTLKSHSYSRSKRHKKKTVDVDFPAFVTKRSLELQLLWCTFSFFHCAPHASPSSPISALWKMSKI